MTTVYILRSIKDSVDADPTSLDRKGSRYSNGRLQETLVAAASRYVICTEALTALIRDGTVYTYATSRSDVNWS